MSLQNPPFVISHPISKTREAEKSKQVDTVNISIKAARNTCETLPSNISLTLTFSAKGVAPLMWLTSFDLFRLCSNLYDFVRLCSASTTVEQGPLHLFGGKSLSEVWSTLFDFCSTLFNFVRRQTKSTMVEQSQPHLQGGLMKVLVQGELQSR